MNKLIAIVVVLLAAIGGVFYFVYTNPATVAVTPSDVTTPADTQATTTPVVGASDSDIQSIGKSVEGRDIMAYHFGATAIGTSTKKVLFVGGLHGGYEWNTSLVANNLIEYLKANPTVIPATVSVTVIPVVNPDGLSKVVATTTSFTAADVNTSQEVQVAGRFNAHTVDLNRNFDCDWQAKGVWQKKTVDGGTAAFSEPESAAMKAYIEDNTPDAVVVWYSSAGGVYSSSCHNGVLPETSAMTKLFAKASGYPAHDVFNYYEITGDMVNWMAKQKIPAISVLLTTHTDAEWDKNKAGVDALLQHLAQ